ncbi:ABC transporter substrate-binding protein [Falsirhodobacter xinxiangensis]|uniref:ABC transporter substrate-binding protein n=1 Tax=Falsirhodobacter xinxiangensis TaxID=2530049 RepID=UPI00145BFFE6|nr:ABC transporter substrate-binding protein [Rhodobacter xinxiangensis]
MIRSLLLSAGFAALCSGAAHAQAADNTLRFAYNQTLESPNPYFTTLRLGVIVGRNVWDTLVARGEDGAFQPLLATEWTWADDTTLDLTLREGVTFHDGSALDADDVVETLTYVSTPANGIVSQQIAGWIASVEKTGPLSVRIKAKAPTPAAMEYLSTQLAIFPAGYFTGPQGQTQTALPVGTGPYRIDSYAPGGELRLARNEAYFEGSPKAGASIDTVSIRIVPDIQTQLADLMSGGIDLVMGLPRDMADQLGMMPGVSVVSGETMRIVFLQMNTTETGPEALKDVRVRQAINHAIDRKAISENLVGTGSTVIDAICFAGQFGCTQDVTSYDFDPEKAKALLAEAGVSGLTVSLAAYRERHISEAIINYLADVGIGVNLQFMQPAAMRDAMRAHQVDMMQNAWGAYSMFDASATAPTYFGGMPDDNNGDPELKALFDEAGVTMDGEKRKELYAEGFARIADQAYAVPMFTLPIYYAGTEGLSFETHPDEILRFWEMSWN